MFVFVSVYVCLFVCMCVCRCPCMGLFVCVCVCMRVKFTMAWIQSGENDPKKLLLMIHDVTRQFSETLLTA